MKGVIRKLQAWHKNIKLETKQGGILLKKPDISYAMKEKLHKELNRIAKHILAANDSSELASLYEASKSLYEKLAVLRFVERELQDPSLDVSKNELADKFNEMASQVLKGNEGVPENNPHPTDIITPGMDTINDMVSEMPFQPADQYSEGAAPLSEIEFQKLDHSAASNSLKPTTQTTLNGQYGAALHFGLNDKIAFVQHLFEGDEDNFKRVISQLSTIETQERAFSFIENLVKPEYGNWEGKEAYEARFLNLLSQRYQ